MKRWMKLSGLLCAAAATAALGFTSLGNNNTGSGQAMEPVCYDGTVMGVANGQLTMNHIGNGWSEEVVVNLTEETKILDAVNGFPMSAEELDPGEAVRVYVGPAMTMSLPPITNGVLVLADVPADAGFPILTAVESCVRNPEGDYTLKTTDGASYTVNSSTSLLPYLTRQIVTEADLTPGARILLWTDSQLGTFPVKIVIFTEGLGDSMGAGEEQQVENGWQKIDGSWYYYENGQMKTGWLLDNGGWYYLDPATGRMQTGFLTLGGKTYFLTESGRMLTKTRTFVPDENGVLH